MPSRLGALLVLLWAGVAAAGEPPALLLARGISRYRAGELRQALDPLRRAFEGEPALAAAGHYLGLAQIRLGQVKQGRRTLSRAARLDPENPRLLLDLGLAYLEEGNPAWAARSLRTAKALDPLDGRTRYYLGVALLRLGHSDEAVKELGASRHEPGVDWRHVRLQLGLAHYQAGRWAAARDLIGPVMRREMGGDLAGQLMRATFEAEGTAAGWVDGQITVGGVADSNPLYDHEREGPAAVGPGVSGSLTLRPYVGARASVWGEVAGSRVFYFPTSEQPAGETAVQDASRTDLRGSAFLGWRFPLERGQLQLSAGYAFSLILLDGAPPLADVNHIFLEQHGGQLALQHTAEDGATLQLRYSLSRDDYAELPRSCWGNELGLEHSRALWGSSRLLTWISLRHELAYLPDYDALTPGAGVGMSYLAPWDLVLGLRLGYEHEDHYRSGRVDGRWLTQQASGRVVTTQRLDNTLGVTAEVGRGLAWGLRLRLVYQWLRNFSTVEQFDYDRHLATLNLSWSSS